MLEVLQDVERIRDDLVRRPALEVGDEAHAARIVLAPCVVEALRLRPRIDALWLGEISAHVSTSGAGWQFQESCCVA